MLKKSRVTMAVALALPLVLTGCLATGGGAFNVEKVDKSRIVEGPQRQDLQNYIVVKANPEGSTHTMSYAVEVPVATRLAELQKSNGDVERALVNLSPTMAHEISPKEEKFWKKEKDFALINDEKPYDISSIGSGTDYVQWMRDLKAVKVGRIETPGDPDRKIPDSSLIYYFGLTSPMEFPTDGTVTYKGYFDATVPYVDFDERNNDFHASKSFYKYSSMARSDVELTVDFSKKEVTKGHFVMEVGKVKSDHKIEVLRNFIDLKIQEDAPWSIKGTTFSGGLTGKAKLNDAKEKPINAWADGEFFGKSGEELAGKFVSVDSLTSKKADGELVGVFGLKADNGSIASLNKEAIKFAGLKWHNDEAVTDSWSWAGNYTFIKDTDDEDHAPYNVVPVTDRFKNLTFAKFGNGTGQGYPIATLMGDLSKEIPTVGKSSYHGEWSGTGKTTFANPKDLEADYEVNWQEQSLKGTLWGMNQSKATDSKEGFGKLDAQITSNTFNGKVTFNKLKMDASKQTAITDTFSGEIKVRGGFFGPNANELAGIGAKPSSDGVNADFLVMFSGKAVQSESTPNGSNQAQ